MLEEQVFFSRIIPVSLLIAFTPSYCTPPYPESCSHLIYTPCLCKREGYTIRERARRQERFDHVGLFIHIYNLNAGYTHTHNDARATPHHPTTHDRQVRETRHEGLAATSTGRSGLTALPGTTKCHVMAHRCHRAGVAWPRCRIYAMQQQF